VDQLAEAHVTALAFSGGEPITRKDFFQVARYAADKGLYISLASNGTLLTKENVAKLREAKVNYIDISIDGATAKTSTTSEESPEPMTKQWRVSKTASKQTYAPASPPRWAKTT
jgi:MoaA/NifB/PqqE/SkfB family radical SAM enzyme